MSKLNIEEKMGNRGMTRVKHVDFNKDRVVSINIDAITGKILLNYADGVVRVVETKFDPQILKKICIDWE